MRQRALPVWHRFHVLAFAGMMLGAVSSVRADEEPPKDKPLLSPERAEALKTRKTVVAASRGYRIPPVPVGLIPKELKFEPGKLSLVPDPADSGGGLIAVYLINAGDQEVWGADTIYAQCFLEVNDGNRWRACEQLVPGCITIPRDIPQPERLQPGHAKIFHGIDPNHGDMTGELRFCLTIQNDRPIVSASFQGRFSSKQFEEAALPPSPASKAIVDGINGKGEDKANDRSRWRIAGSPEEYIAAAELERCYDESGATKTALIRWQASIPAGEEKAACRKALAALLERPWDRQKDAPALFDRCFTALTRHDGGNADFGSPEHCRAMVWRYLSQFRSEWLDVFINPERWDQLETIRQSGNPWGVDQKRVAVLVEEATASLRSTDRDEREAAGIFLDSSKVGKWLVDVRDR